MQAHACHSASMGGGQRTTFPCLFSPSTLESGNQSNWDCQACSASGMPSEPSGGPIGRDF